MIAAIGLGPAVFVLGSLGDADHGGASRTGGAVPMVDIHDFPAFYHGRRVSWDLIRRVRDRPSDSVLEIDVRHVGKERVVLFDSEAEHVAWLCQQGYQHQGCRNPHSLSDPNRRYE